ncbi:MAG: hypothetical protein V9G12_08880 [Microthrixaceae bacterium]
MAGARAISRVRRPVGSGFGEGEGQGLFLPGAEEGEGGLAIGAGGFDGEGEVSRFGEGGAGSLGDDVAGFQARGFGKAAGGDGVDQQALGAGAKGFGDLAVYRAGGEAEGREGRQGFVDKAGDDAVEFRRRDGVGDADEHPAAVGDLGVHAEKAAFGVDQRAAGGAGVHGGVVLQHQHGDGDVGLAGEGGDAAFGQGEFDAEGGAEGEDFVAKLRSVGGELQALRGGGKGDDGHVAHGVAGDDEGGDVGAVAVDQADVLGGADDMGVGDGDAAIGPDEGGPEEAVLGVVGAHGEDLVHRVVEGRGAGGAEECRQRQDQKRGQRLDDERSLPLFCFRLHS